MVAQKVKDPKGLSKQAQYTNKNKKGSAGFFYRKHDDATCFVFFGLVCLGRGGSAP